MEKIWSKLVSFPVFTRTKAKTNKLETKEIGKETETGARTRDLEIEVDGR